MPTDTLAPTVADRTAVAHAAAGALDRGLHQTVAAIAAASPELPALRLGETTVGYGRLDATADAWAARLAAAGVGPGDVVPIVLPRGLDLVTALLAVLKTGAAYALLDPAWPTHRRAEAVAALGDPPLLIGPAHAAVPGLALTVPDAPAADAGFHSAAVHDIDPAFRPAAVCGTDPCCVFFTSGTTGEPKPVLVPHQALSRLFAPDGFAAFGPQAVVPLAAPMPWDAFALELWSVLLTGGTSVVITEPYLSAAALRESIAWHGANTVWLTASVFNMIVDEDIEAFDGLRQVMTGGERLSSAHVRRFLHRHRGVALLNGYGPVENTVFATTRRLVEADCDRPGGVPLGVAVPGTEVHVLDGERVCGAGETGEICLSGSGLALAYLNDDALTAAKFVRIRLGERTLRVYRTGDLGAWASDGLLEFHGRADRQVKVRGHRIEPEAVERQIERALPQVRECRVVVRRGSPGAPAELLAFCRPVESGDPLADAAGLLRSALVSAHQPAAVVSLDAFPRTDRGKLDERALLALVPAPATQCAAAQAEPAVRAADAGPLAAVERAYREVLGLAGIHHDVPFVALGGTSLQAGRICARLGADLARPVPLSVFHDHSSIAALTAWLTETAPPPDEREAETQSAKALSAGPDAVALTPMQLVYLARQLQDPADLTSVCLLVWSVTGDLDRAALAEALAAVHARHEPLRSIYTADPRPSAIPFDLPAPPLIELPGQDTVEAAQAVLRTLLAAEFDLETGEVWRTALIPVGAGRAWLFGCAVHHIAFDGWSESVLAADLSAAYGDVLGGGRPQLAPVPSAAEVARALAERRACVDPAAQTERRLAELAGVPDLRWPGTPPAPRAGSEPEHRTVPLSHDLLRTLDALAADRGTTRFSVLLALYAASLAEVTGQDDFAVGIPAAQRDIPALAHVIGCHITTLCVRLHNTALRGDGAAIEETTAAVARAAAAQDVAHSELLRRLNPPRTGRPPLYQTMFALQDNAAARLNLPGARTALRRQHYLDLPLELHAEFWPNEDGGLDLVVSHRPDAVPGQVAADLAERFTERLRRLPAASSGKLPRIPQQESRR